VTSFRLASVVVDGEDWTREFQRYMALPYTLAWWRRLRRGVARDLRAAWRDAAGTVA